MKKTQMELQNPVIKIKHKKVALNKEREKKKSINLFLLVVFFNIKSVILEMLLIIKI